MAITNGYCSLTELKAYATISTTDATDDGALEDLIEAASRVIDDVTRRTFYARTETKYYNVPSGQANNKILYLDDDLLTVTTLTNGSYGTLTTAQYWLLPRNAAAKWAVELRPSSGITWTSDTAGDSQGAITIAGTWGYSSTTPDDIKQACLMIARSYMFKRDGQSVEGIAQVTGAGMVISPADIPREAAIILNSYRRLL